MMRNFLLFCAFIVAGSFLVYQVQQGSGYVLVVWGETSIEMSLWFGLAVLLLFVFALYLVITIIRSGFLGIDSARQKIAGYSSQKAQQKTIAGLIAFIEGDWSSAHRQLTRAAKKVSSPIINYLAAARCAYEMGNEQEALQLLHSAEKSTQNSELAVALTQVRMQLSNQQFEQALAILSRASKLSPNHNVILKLQQKVYIALKDWAALKKLLPKLHQQDIGSVKERYHLEKMLYRELLAEQVHKNKRLPEEEKFSALSQCWKSLPNHFQQDEQVVTVYVSELVDLQKYSEAKAVLEKSLRKSLNNEWIKLYGLITCTDKKAELIHAEKWLTVEPKNATVLLAVGRLCLQNQQWGRAKDFFKASLSLDAQAETYAELARLQNFLGEKEESQQAYQAGLLSTASTLVDISEFKK